MFLRSSVRQVPGFLSLSSSFHSKEGWFRSVDRTINKQRGFALFLRSNRKKALLNCKSPSSPSAAVHLGWVASGHCQMDTQRTPHQPGSGCTVHCPHVGENLPVGGVRGSLCLWRGMASFLFLSSYFKIWPQVLTFLWLLYCSFIFPQENKWWTVASQIDKEKARLELCFHLPSDMQA